MDDINKINKNIIIFVNAVIATGAILLKIINPIVATYTEEIKKADIINFSVFTPVVMVVLSIWIYKTIKPAITQARYIHHLSNEKIQDLREMTFNLPLKITIQFLVVILSIVSFVAIIWDGYFYEYYPLYKRLISMFLIWSYSICMSMAVYIYSKQKLTPILRLTSGIAYDIGYRIPIKTKISVTTLTLSAMIFLFVSVYAYSQIREALSENDFHLSSGNTVNLTDQNVDNEAGKKKSSNELLDNELHSVSGVIEEAASVKPVPIALIGKHIVKEDKIRNIIIFLFTIGFFFVIFSGYIGYYVANDTSATIKDIENEMIKISQKEDELYKEIGVVSLDEVGDLTKAFNNLQRMILLNHQKLETANRKIAEMEREKIKKALEESKRRYLLLAENSTDVIWTMDLSDQKLTYVSPSAFNLTNFEAQEIQIMGIKGLLTPGSFDFFERTLKAFALYEDESHRDRTLELEVLKKDGSNVWTETNLTLFPATDDRQPQLLGVTRNISERKNFEEQMIQSTEQLRSLSSHLQSVREEERSHIAREIHDELGQILTALKIDFDWLKKKSLNMHDQTHEKSESMVWLIDSALQTVKRISTELHPSVLDHLGLSAAIEWHLTEFRERTGITCDLIMEPDDIVLDKDRSITIFRILQEALTNIIRHSGATKVHVELKMNDNLVELSVSDNGIGIKENQLSETSSIGLIGIRERIYFWKGNTLIKGEPNKGTTLKVSIPLEDGNDKNFDS